MADERSDLGIPFSREDDLESFGELERRVLALVDQLRKARTQSLKAEREIGRLRDQLRERDTQIVVLKDELRSDGTREAVKRRVEALLRKIAELENAG